MKVEVNKLKHHPFNAEVYKLSDIDSLKESILNVGLLEPLVINKKNEVISGNRRLEALKELTMEKKIPYSFGLNPKVNVIVKELQKDEEPLHIISHNSQRVKTARELLNEIKVLFKYYSKGQGFRSDTSVNTNRGTARESVSIELNISQMKIQRLLFIDEVFSELIDLIDEGKLTINQAYIEAKRRKVYQTIATNGDTAGTPNVVRSDRFEIHNKSSANMNELKDKSVNMIMTSPPYYSLRNYGRDEQIGLEKSIDAYLNNLMTIFNECRRVLSDDGSVWVVIGDSYTDGCLGSVPHRFAIEMMNNGWIQRNCIVWHKTNPKPESIKTRLGTSNEFIFFFTKSKQDYYFDCDSIRQPYKYNQFEDIRSPRHHSLNGDIQLHTPVIQNPKGKIPNDYIETAKHSFGIGKKLGMDDIEHGAVYPSTLCHMPIKATSKVDDMVLDPFCGSGTTGDVCMELGRRFVGYEINSNFVELANVRLSSTIEGMKRKNGKMD